MNTQPDFEDFLRLLEIHRVDYMIVGGYALAYHGFPRFTKDIDIFFSDAGDNLVRLQAALVNFGFQPATVPIETLGRPDAVLAVGMEPVRIDLLNRIDGAGRRGVFRSSARRVAATSGSSRSSPSQRRRPAGAGPREVRGSQAGEGQDGFARVEQNHRPSLPPAGRPPTGVSSCKRTMTGTSFRNG
jgi:hypothetical protein